MIVCFVDEIYKVTSLLKSAYIGPKSTVLYLYNRLGSNEFGKCTDTDKRFKAALLKQLLFVYDINNWKSLAV